MSNVYKSEPSGTITGGGSCNYTSLAAYNQNATFAPLNTAVPSMATQIVPVNGMVGYNVLNYASRPDAGCVGSHPSISVAYGMPGGACQGYTKRLCSG